MFNRFKRLFNREKEREEDEKSSEKLFFRSSLLEKVFKQERKVRGKTLNEWWHYYYVDNSFEEYELFMALNELKPNTFTGLYCEKIDKVFWEASDPFLLTLIIILYYSRGKFPNNYVERASALLTHKDSSFRRSVGESLVELNDIDGLIAVLEAEDSGRGNMMGAARRLASKGKEAEKAIPALLGMIQYKNINYKGHSFAAEALASIGESARPVLVQCINSKDSHLIEYATYALEMLDSGINYKDLYGIDSEQ
ncbi:MAG: hypothetical protein MK212_00070 [Saprospiraceae bacterium]|nr:hypothetical protein [Saprospiraceae bacterium]